ncbi:hypothetical protein DOE63_12475 [Salmonella enterica subsp. diarizonae serovar 59:z10:-]|nr:hypothetical protein DOE63_12475 [Salmonella enterica subsp. diarizonae serovar 59:z10:-]
MVCARHAFENVTGANNIAQAARRSQPKPRHQPEGFNNGESTMTRNTIMKVNAAIRWHQQGEALKNSLENIACQCCDEDKEGDVYEIATLIDHVNNGKKLKQIKLTLPGFAK